MFDTTRAFSGFSVDDIEKAREFYSGTLEIPTTEANGMLTLQMGDRGILIYPKENHVPAEYTMLNFAVDEIGPAVEALAAKGVSMEQYDGVDEQGVNRRGGPLIAWFKDPAGNVLSVIEQK